MLVAVRSPFNDAIGTAEMIVGGAWVCLADCLIELDLADDLAGIPDAPQGIARLAHSSQRIGNVRTVAAERCDMVEIARPRSPRLGDPDHFTETLRPVSIKLLQLLGGTFLH